MGWFKIDDGFHCHTKVYAAGTAAVGLYVRCGSWVAQQATDGVIPQAVARQYGTPKMIKALIASGMWHQPSHGCKTCPAVAAGTYYIHQYLERNPSRAELDAERKAKAQRQQRWREGKRAGRDDTENDGPSTDSRRQNDEETTKFRRYDDEETTSEAQNLVRGQPKDSKARDSGSSNVDASTDTSHLRHGDAAPTHPVPSPVSPKGDTEGIGTDPGAALARIGDRPRIPDASRPLVDKITAAGMVVGWDLATAEWFLIEALIKRCTVDALVVSAAASWQGARKQPRSASYFIPAWRKLADAPAPGAALQMPAIGGQVHSLPDPGQHRIATSDQRFGDALGAGLRVQALMDAKNAQESS